MVGSFSSSQSRLSDANVILWSGAAATAVIGVMTSGILQIIGVVLSSVILLAILWNTFANAAIHRWRMKHPFSAYFASIERVGERPREHTVKANDKIVVQINRDFSITHREFVLTMGFEGDEDKRPQIISLENPFVKRGKAKYGSPDENENQIITDKDRYQIKGEENRVKGNTAAIGLVIETRGPGRYEMYFRTITEAGEGRPKCPLTLIVEG